MPITNSGQIPLFDEEGKPFKVNKSPTWKYGHRTRYGIEVPKTISGTMDKRSKGYKSFREEDNKRNRDRRAAIKSEKEAKLRKEEIRRNRKAGAKKGWQTRQTNILKKASYNKFAFAAGAGLAATAGIGMMFSGQHEALSNPGGLFSPRTKPEDVRNASFWTRQSSIMAGGHLDPNRTALGGMLEYNAGRIADTAKTMFSSPFGSSGISPATAAGASIGGGMSVIGASSVAAYKTFSGGGMKKAWNNPGKFFKPGKKGVAGMLGIVGAGLSGALFGGYQGTKVDIAFSRAIKTARKNVLTGGARRMSNRAHTEGRGYRMWASPRGTRKMGQPGHLGMDGSMAFAMHNARHRSTLG